MLGFPRQAEKEGKKRDRERTPLKKNVDKLSKFEKLLLSRWPNRW